MESEIVKTKQLRKDNYYLMIMICLLILKM